MKRLSLVFILLIPFTAFASTQMVTANTPSHSSTIVKETANRYRQFLLKSGVFFRLKHGIKIEQLPGFSIKAEESRIKEIRSMRAKLQAVNPAHLSYDENLSLKILEWVLDNRLEAHRFFLLKSPIATYGSPIPHINRLYTRYHFRETGDPDRYLRLLDQYAGFIEEITSLLKYRYRNNIILPKPALKPAVSYLESLVRPAGESFLYVNRNRLNTGRIFRGTREIVEFQEKVSTTITSRVNPALERMLVFIRGDYFKRAPEDVGLWQYPGGTEFYKFLVKFRTTLDVTPGEVHRTGLREIERLREKLDVLKKEVKFKGDLDAFLHYIKTDRRFVPGSPGEMGEQLLYYKNRAEAKLPLFFSKIPRAPCTVKRLNPRLEGSMTYGFYQPPMDSDPVPIGVYWYNASHLEKKNRLFSSSAGLILHELVPGHHFQVCLQSENEALPAFRRDDYITPYAEGWAEYASHLGEEMGVYETPYERCGRVMQDIFMAVRLVVDTGMNYFKWSRKKAAEFMKKYTLLSDVEIESETLRYAADTPGHALGYWMGFLKMTELRRKAEKTLGPKFNIFTFHDALLDRGTMPLTLLDEHVEHYINNEKK